MAQDLNEGSLFWVDPETFAIGLIEQVWVACARYLNVSDKLVLVQDISGAAERAPV